MPAKKKLTPSEKDELGLDEFFDLSRDLMCIAGADGYLKRLNGAWEKTLGWTPDDLLKKPFTSFIHPDDIEATNEMVARQVKGEAAKAFENRYRCKDGSYRWLEWTATPARNGVILGCARDISNSKWAEERILQSEKRFKNLFEKAPIAYQSLNIDGKFIEINQAWLDMFGYSRDEVIGYSFQDFLVEEGFVEKNLPAFKSAGEIHLPGTKMLCGDDAVKVVFIEGRIGYDEEKNFLQTHCMLIDLTERTQVEMELREAKEEADIANRAKSEFLATMSHDLRTPLNAIIGFSEMMKMESFGPLGNPRYKEYAEDILNSDTLLVSLINDILDLSKIEAEKYELFEAPLDIAELIEACANMNRLQANAKSIRLKTNVAPDLPFLLGDERTLAQVFNNLLSNAIKFTLEDGLITISAEQNGSRALDITIADTGIGMSKQDIHKAIAPFEQADSNYASRHEGTGLGLYLCNNLVKLHGGTLDIKSTLKKGTSVTVHFPADRIIANPSS
jgi:PAS domain S-box-containing protein